MIVPYIENKKIDYNNIKEILSESEKIGQFTNNGPVKQLLEEELHQLLDLPIDKKVVCVSSGTSALHLLLLYYTYIEKKVNFWGSPSFTFPSSVVNFEHTNLYDINTETFTLDIPNNLEILDLVNGFIITNLFGTNCNIEKWQEFSNKTGAILLFDNCSSFLTKVNNKNICCFGHAAFGSLHHTKSLGFGEGGFVVIDENKYDIINSLANFGFNNSRKYNKYSSNFKMSDISAAFILDHIRNYNLDRHEYLQNRLIYDLENIERIEIFNYDKNNGSIVLGNLPILFKNNIDNKIFKDVGIEANKYYYPLVENHKNSWDIYNKIVNFPLHAGLTDYQIDFMVKQIKIKANEQ